MIAKVLKEYRKKNSMSVRDVAFQLGEKSNRVAEKTIYGWESGQSQPDADTLFTLCEIYGIDDMLSAFGYSDEPPFHITLAEKKIVKAMRRQPEMIPAIKKILDV